jgi:hypothetical protein
VEDDDQRLRVVAVGACPASEDVVRLVGGASRVMTADSTV